MSDASRVLRVIGLIFAGLGLVGLAVALVLVGREMFATQGMLPSVGEVVAFQNRKPVVRFPIGDTRHVTIVGGTATTPPAYDIGQKLPVYFDPNQPTHAFIDTYLERWFVPSLVGGLAFLFAVLGAGVALHAGHRKRRIAWLRRNGTKVSGRIVDVSQSRIVNLNRRPTWQIAATWDANGLSGRALSFHMTRDPRSLLGERRQIDVWVDPKNAKRAWVDTDFLDPEHAVGRTVEPVQRR